mmetsp:Transcript_110511/g.293572  ORF Transcript_110511/g.293572 Transcript_110511/m.293572 type:complete len:223 (-) Transcript_110511:319-987(-)
MARAVRLECRNCAFLRGTLAEGSSCRPVAGRVDANAGEALDGPRLGDAHRLHRSVFRLRGLPCRAGACVQNAPRARLLHTRPRLRGAARRVVRGLEARLSSRGVAVLAKVLGLAMSALALRDCSAVLCGRARCTAGHHAGVALRPAEPLLRVAAPSLLHVVPLRWNSRRPLAGFLLCSTLSSASTTVRVLLQLHRLRHRRHGGTKLRHAPTGRRRLWASDRL